jgi:UDP:flavonoid glycosyltransferase YjiC (YdhE family)
MMSMRILFTSIGTTGHLHPLLPYAYAAQAAGHQVAFATPPVATAVVAGLGIPAFAVGPDLEGYEAVRLAGFDPDGLSTDEQNRLLVRYWSLGDHLTERIRDLVDLATRWRPDLIVRGEIESGGCVVAERLGLPHASIKAYPQRDWREIPSRLTILAERLGKLRDQVGLPPDPVVAMPYHYLEVWPFPPSFRQRPYPASTCRSARPIPFDHSGPEGLPAWIDDLPPREAMPRVYVTLGTTGPQSRRPEVFPILLDGLRDEQISLIMTVSRDFAPASLGPQPTNVHVERYIPQTLLFPHCDLVVSHAGAGTVLCALDHGLPQVMIPFSADQPDNARAGTAQGYALAVSPQELTPESIRAAVRTVLADPTYRANARHFQAEIHAMPGPEEVVGWFERLARGGCRVTDGSTMHLEGDGARDRMATIAAGLGGQGRTSNGRARTCVIAATA